MGRFARISCSAGIFDSDEELQEVADAYREAVRLGVPVQNAVAETFNVSRSTAAKRIMAARKMGYLRPLGREGET